MSGLIVIGGAHPDRCGKFQNTPAYETSCAGTLTESLGGAAFNAAMAAKEFIDPIWFASVRGTDPGGRWVAQHLEIQGVTDLSLVSRTQSTASYTALFTPGGELLLALADMHIYDDELEEVVRSKAFAGACSQASAVLADSNLPECALDALFRSAKTTPVYLLVASVEKVQRIEAFVPQLAGLFLNLAEARCLLGNNNLNGMECLRALATKGVARVAITDGANPAVVIDHNQVSQHPPALRVSLNNVNGAGDTLAGVALARYIQGHSFADAVRFGLAASLTIIESANPDFQLGHSLVEQNLLRLPPYHIKNMDEES